MNATCQFDDDRRPGAEEDLPRRRRGRQGDRLRRRRRRGVRAARPERRRQVDDDRDADDDDRADVRNRAAGRLRRRRGADRGARRRSVVFQEAVVDGGLSGRANLELHARLWGVEARPGRHPDRRAVPAFGLDGADRPAGRQLQRRPAPPTRDRARARVAAAGAVPGRADRRPRPPHPPRVARRDRRACAAARR